MPPVAARLRLIGKYLAPVLLAAAGSVLDWPGWVVGFLIIIAMIVYGAVRPTRTGKTLPKPPLRRFLGFVLWTSAFVSVVATFHAARLTVLDLAGSPATATIDYMEMDRTIHRGGRVEIDYCYHLKRSDGGWVSGSLCRDAQEYSRGQTVAVLADPTGLVAPETPASVATVALFRNTALITYALIILAALLGGGPAAPERPLVPRQTRYPRWRPSPPRPQARPRARARRKSRRR